MKSRVLNIVAPFIAIVAFLGIWELLVRVLEVETWILPPPTAIFTSMIRDFPEYWPHIWTTGLTILLGFLIAIPVGLIVASLVTSSKLLSAALSPYITMLVITPLMTLIPLLQLWMGYGMKVRVIAVIIQSFAVVNMNACTGFLNVPNIRHELMQSMGANRLQTYFRMLLPSAATDIFTGIRLAAIFSTTACISSEYVGGNMGLGSRIIYYKNFLKSEQAFACIFYVMILGILLHCLVKFAQKKIVKWKI